ncbi:MAG: hypothetical protein IKY44_00785 [Clostridia bacterium]|nr:hypothetical protein [Clostridia bacterium]
MKAAFQIRIRAMCGVVLCILSAFMYFLAEIVEFSESTIFYCIFAVLINFIALVFYFADAFRYKNMPSSRLTKNINNIVLLVLILGVIPIFVLFTNGEALNSYIPFVASYVLYNLILTALTITSVVHDVRKCKN